MKRHRRSVRPHFIHYLEFASLFSLVAIIRLIPSRFHKGIAKGVSGFWFFFFPFRKQVVLQNLCVAFPDKNEQWRRQTARACVSHFVRMGLEFTDMQRRGSAALEGLLEDIEGIEHYDAVGANRSAYVFVTGHLGNWELAISYFTAFKGLKMAVLAKPLHNPLVERVVAKARKERGYEVIYTRGDDLRNIVRNAKQGKPLGFVADQDARRTGIFIDFFSKPASTFQGPALFAHRLNLPILVGTCCRSDVTGKFRIRFFPPIIPNPKADREKELERLTRLHVTLLESAIREHPDQYFWFHKRWKTKPKQKRE